MPVHPTAIVSDDATLADDVEVGPFSVIEGPVKLAAGVKIDGHALLRGRITIGARCTVGWGAVIGADPQDQSFDPATDSGITIGEDNTLREYTTIHRGSTPGAMTRIGDRNYLMAVTHVGHDAVLDNDIICANNVLVGGHVHIGDRAFLGGSSGCHQFVKIGTLAIIQAMAPMTQDLPPFCIGRLGNKLGGLNVIGLRRAGLDATARAEIKRLYKILFQSDLTLSAAIEQASATPWSDTARPLLDAVANPSRKGVIIRGARR